MRALKFATVAMVVATTSFYVSADNDVLNIKLKGGARAQCNVMEIENVSFDESSDEPVVNEIRGIEYVDLGLPSGLLWATSNLFADNPFEYGDYYAWGELYTKNNYNIFESSWTSYSFDALRDYGVIDEDGNLTANYDVVTVNYGSPWRIPSKQEFQELVDCCTWAWVEPEEGEDCAGAFVTGPNGNIIFLPAAGNYHEFRGEHGNYWTASVSVEDDRAWAFYFNGNGEYCTKELRGAGLTIRPVASRVEDDM